MSNRSLAFVIAIIVIGILMVTMISQADNFDFENPMIPEQSKTAGQNIQKYSQTNQNP